MIQKPVAIAGFIAASAVALSAQNYKTALPGTVNYVEGQVSVNGQPLDSRQDGAIQLKPNESLTTANGKAEILLSPGVFLRAGVNSEIRMVSSGLADPTVEVVHGSALLEVDRKLKDARFDVLEHGATATILKEGLYRFDSNRGAVATIDGKMSVVENGNIQNVGKGHEVVLNGGPLKAVGFDRKAEDDLYRWSSVRSGYLAQANQSTAARIYGGYGPYWGNGWYWNPYFAAWSWLPGDGYFYSPFGYSFYSPAYVVYAPYRFGYGYRSGFAPRASGFRGGGRR
ncbi:MAG: hypothetical protein M3N93_06335 [Acidobacteriota bacterium]|nr:hypothetical protein [Acidobacteriota bacterium]